MENDILNENGVPTAEELNVPVVEEVPAQESAPVVEAAPMEDEPTIVIQEQEPVAQPASEQAPWQAESAYGQQDSAQPQYEYAYAPQPQRKKLIQRWWFWVIAGVLSLVLLIVGIGACAAGSDSGSSGGSSYVPTLNPYVQMVKTAKNSNYGITYGAAFDSFFSSPKWSYFEADSGEDVVEFTGGFSYDGAPATAKIQFIVDASAGTLEVYHLSINGVAQSRLVLAAMVKKVFESY